MSEITKQKAGKPDWSTILSHIPNALEAMIRVREYGHAKYSRIAQEAGVAFDSEGWRTNPPEDYLNSAARHLVAAMKGARVNEQDGGVNHLAQAMIDLAFAFEIEAQGGPRVRIASDAEKAEKYVDVLRKEGAVRVNVASAPEADELGPACDPEEAVSRIEAAKESPHQRPYFWGKDGKHVDLIVDHPDKLPSLVEMVDILSRKKRFADHHDSAISVTRHQILVAKIALWKYCNTSDLPKLVRSCLAHDMAEALYGDIPSPLKQLERSMLPKHVKHPNDRLTAQFNDVFDKRYATYVTEYCVKRCDLVAGYIEASVNGVAKHDLEQWFDKSTCEMAQEYGFTKPYRYMFQAWTHEDDSAAWWRMWTTYGGETPTPGPNEGC